MVSQYAHWFSLMFWKSKLLQGTSKAQCLRKPSVSWGTSSPIFQKEFQNYSSSNLQTITRQTKGDTNVHAEPTIQPTPGSSKTLLTINQRWPTALPLALRKRWSFLLFPPSFPIYACLVPFSALNSAQKASLKICSQLHMPELVSFLLLWILSPYANAYCPDD